MLNSYTDLRIFQGVSVTCSRYCTAVQIPYVHLFRGAICPKFLFMNDNGPLYRKVSVAKLLDSNDIQRMDWPASSLYINPIEYVWYALGKCLAARPQPQATISKLRLTLQEEWATILQQLIDNHLLSMNRPCKSNYCF